MLCLAHKIPDRLASGGYSRTTRRLATFGTIATIPFIALVCCRLGPCPARK